MGDEVGLCRTCRWMRPVTNRRGSTFYRCVLSETDSSYRRYPALPVVRCQGYQESTEHGAGSREDR